MKQIQVKIKASIAEKSGGFLDLSASQSILPPKRENGMPEVDHVFCVIETDFIRSKLRSGELILADDEISESETGNSGSDDDVNKLSGLTAPETGSGSSENTLAENISSDPEDSPNADDADQATDAKDSDDDNSSVNENGAETSDDGNDSSKDSGNNNAE